VVGFFVFKVNSLWGNREITPHFRNTVCFEDFLIVRMFV